MPKDDAVYLVHMRESAGKIVARTSSKTRADFDGSEDLQLVLAFLIQNLGEAAARVSAERCERHPEIPWRQIIGMRNRIVHDYLHIDADIVWEVATRNVPDLIVRLDEAIAGGQDERPGAAP